MNKRWPIGLLRTRPRIGVLKLSSMRRSLRKHKSVFDKRARRSRIDNGHVLHTLFRPQGVASLPRLPNVDAARG